jgi:RecQ-mediated genome instability protein 1
MSKGTGFNPNITQATEDLQGPPILVQIVAMTEIGTSAFQLEQTRVAREERMRSGLGNIEGEEDGDVEVEGEGPMPKYPRGTLRFQLSDGETIIDAMEFRNLPQLSLGVTELGYKVSLPGQYNTLWLMICLDATARYKNTEWNGFP